MVKLILKPLTDGDKDVVVEKGKTTLGRGTLLNVSTVRRFSIEIVAVRRHTSTSRASH